MKVFWNNLQLTDWAYAQAADIQITGTVAVDSAAVLPRTTIVALNYPGSGFVVDDTLTLSYGTNTATVKVLTVDGSGAILTYSELSNNFLSERYLLAATGGHGSGSFFSIAPQSYKKFYYRGNQQITFQFTVRKEFSSLQDAQAYLLTHFTSLAKSGDCHIICGGPDDASTQQTVALIWPFITATPIGIFNGIEVVHRYTIVAMSALAIADGAHPSDILMEDSGDILTESGDKILTEH